MDITKLAELGAAIVAIIALVITVKEFLKFLKRQEESFLEIITNHLTHSNKTNEELKDSNLQLKNVIEQLLDFLKK